MNACERLSDRMASVAHGGGWTEEERVHLDSCPDCSAEWDLLSAGRMMGAEIVVDVEAVARRVRDRLEVASKVRTLPMSRRVLGWSVAVAAAAAAVALLIGRPDRPGEPEEAGVVPGVVLTELDELSPVELESVLDDLDGDPGPGADPGGIGDLSSDELERVLRAWES